MRLIDADALIDDTCVDCLGRECEYWGNYCLDVKYICKAPTVEDAVVVVRCKDCKHVETYANTTDCWCCLHDTPMKLEDFCSYGRNREL